MTAPTPSLFHRLIAATAHRLAQHPSIAPEKRAAFEATAITVMHGVWADICGGHGLEVRLWVPQVFGPARRERHARILAALATGQPRADIARAEGVSLSTVDKLAARAPEKAGATFPPPAGQHRATQTRDGQKERPPCPM